MVVKYSTPDVKDRRFRMSLATIFLVLVTIMIIGEWLRDD